MPAWKAADLAVSPMFLPLLHRSVVYLAGETGRQRLDAKVGERLEVQIPIATIDRQAAAAPGDDMRYAQAGTSDGGAQTAAPERSAGDERTFTVKTPSGRQEALVARYVGRMAILTYEDTHEPGHYVFEGNGRRVARAVNIDTREIGSAADTIATRSSRSWACMWPGRSTVRTTSLVKSARRATARRSTS
jgi:hypothetical protein